MIYRNPNTAASHLLIRSMVLTFVLVLAASFASAQRGSGSMTVVTPGSGQNILYGDLRIDESKAGTNKPLSYTIVLYLAGGTIIGRTTVGNGQRYRFIDLQDGDYDVAVEVETREITRSRVRLYSQPSVGKTDTRHDIELEFRTIGITGNKPATISAGDLYQRSVTNQRLFDAGERATDEKKYDQSIASFRQIVDADPKDFQAWTELGTAYLLKNALDDAEKAYQSAVDARPEFFLANLNLGRLYLTEKKNDAAVEALSRAVKIKPQSADGNQLLGEAYLQVKKGSLAVGYLNEAIRLDPQGKAEIHLRLALLYNNAGLKDKAAAEYEAFLKQRPDYKDRQKLEQYISENKKP